MISHLVATPATTYGGVVTVTASTSGATECKLSAGKGVGGLPVSFPCASGTVERAVTMPVAAGLKPVKHTLTLTAKESAKSTTATTTVTVVPAATSIEAGGAHACAVLASGHIGCWGEGEQGELGNGKHRIANTPVEVSGIGNAAQVSSGGWFTCAALSSGHVDCWGDDDWWETGIEGGKEECKFERTTVIVCNRRPVEIRGISDATQVSASDAAEQSDACALLSTGHIDCWGDDSAGQLGNGTIEYNGVERPVEVQGISNATEVSAGSDYTCALLSTGHVDCWGDSNRGYIDKESPEYSTSLTPVEIPGISEATDVSVGGDVACALLSSGHIECWGYNLYGQLGTGTASGPESCRVKWGETPCSRTPAEVDGIDDATQVSAAEGHTCALLATGGVECWGADYYDQLGTGTQTGPETCAESACSVRPIEPRGLPAAVQVSAYEWGACVLLSAGKVDCWGTDWAGQLGNGSTLPLSPYGTTLGPVEVVGL